MPETGMTEMELLEQDFPFEGNLELKVHTWEDLDAFNESSVCHTIMDFSGVEQIHVWANAAYLNATEKTMEEFCSLKLSECSASLRTLIAHYHEQIQVKKKMARYLHTTYPKRGPLKFYFVQRPFRLSLDGKVKTVIFSDLIPVREDPSDKFRPLEELLRYTNVGQLMIDTETLSVVTGNPAAQFMYMCNREFLLLDGGAKLHLQHIFDSCAWESEEQKKELWAQVRALSLSSEPVEIVVSKPQHRETDVLERERSKSSTLSNISPESMADSMKSLDFDPVEEIVKAHKLVFFPAVNPATGRDALMLSEYDITELKKTQEDLRATNEMQDLTFASISHELRTPLNGIVGLADGMLETTNCPAAFKKSLSVIRAQGIRLNGLVDDILDAASHKRNKLVLKAGTVDLFQVAEGVIDLLRPLVRRSVKLVNGIGQGELPAIEGDSDRITQVLTNLLSNAIKFTEKGSITIRARLAGASVTVEVVDTGIGIPKQRMQQVWGAFQQESRKTTKKYGGTGLGLSLVKTLVEAHGGSVSVTSRYKQVPSGTTFSFSLPLRRDDALPRTPSANSSGSDPDPDSLPRRTSPMSGEHASWAAVQRRASEGAAPLRRGGWVRERREGSVEGREREGALLSREAAVLRRQEEVAEREREVEARERKLQERRGEQQGREPEGAREGEGGRRREAELEAERERLGREVQRLQAELRRLQPHPPHPLSRAAPAPGPGPGSPLSPPPAPEASEHAAARMLEAECFNQVLFKLGDYQDGALLPADQHTGPRSHEDPTSE